MSGSAESRVLIAEIGAARGIRGEVRIRSYAQDPAALADYGPLVTGDGRKLTIRRLKPAGNGLIAEIEGVTTRNDAEALRNVRLYVDRAVLPEPETDEWYYTDLVGLEVRAPGGDAIGAVVAVQDFGAGDLLELRMEGAASTVYVPFTREVVPQVDVAAGFLVLDPPPGLLDEAQEGRQ